MKIFKIFIVICVGLSLLYSCAFLITTEVNKSELVENDWIYSFHTTSKFMELDKKTRDTYYRVMILNKMVFPVAKFNENGTGIMITNTNKYISKFKYTIRWNTLKITQVESNNFNDLVDIEFKLVEDGKYKMVLDDMEPVLDIYINAINYGTAKEKKKENTKSKP